MRPRRLAGHLRTPLVRAFGAPTAERSVLAVLALLCALEAYLVVLVGPGVVPAVGSVVLILVGALLLRRREELLLILVATGALVADGVRLGTSGVRPPTYLVFALVALMCDRIAATRDRVGVPGLRGEAMLAELRDRLARQGELPPLPAGWHAEIALRPAGGAAFGGDFFVARAADGLVELVLVDVSGKGVSAATRALLLSGALGGLLGGVPPDRFLSSANAYLWRQDWLEGFATAAHLLIDPAAGSYRVATAGHPPPAYYHAGSGHWGLLSVDGPALGLLPEAGYVELSGSLGRGDAMLLYTDGLVERPGRDLSVGIDRMLGEANRLVLAGFAGGARRLLDASPTWGDDRAVLLLWRD